jgi:subtilisin family serine protease
VRKHAWIVLIAPLLASLWVDRVVDRSAPSDSARSTATGSAGEPEVIARMTTAVPSGPRERPADRGSPEQTAPAEPRSNAWQPRRPDSESESGPRASSDASPEASIDLDRATANQVVAALERTIERERERRALFVSPGVVETVAHERRVRVIFETGSGSPPARVEALLAGASGSAAFEGLRLFPRLDRGVATVGPQALAHLLENPDVHHIELDAIHRPSLDETVPLVRADLSHQLGYDGDGTAVALIDTGVDPTHPMFADRIVEEACFSAGNDCPNGQSRMLGPGAAIPCAISGCGHGTRVAGIAVGDDPGGTLIGVAPHADLIVVQVFSDVAGAPGAYTSDILAAYQHILGLTAFYSIASVNLSLGGDPFTSEASCDQAASAQYAAVALLRGVGVITVAAAGNEALTNALTSPACLSNVIGVGSTSNGDAISGFSNSASFLGMLAPGEAVRTARNGGGNASASGTSMATPHVTGAIATIREAAPNATVNEIESALALSGVPVLDRRNGVTTPRLRVQNAIDLLQTLTLPPDEADAPPPGGGSGTPAAATTSSSRGGGGGCGLVGLEPFLVLGLVRVWRRRNRERRLATS